MRKLYFLFIACVFSLLFNCKKTTNNTNVSKDHMDSIMYTLNALEDSIAVSWTSMSKNEEDLFFDVNRLLQEIEYIPGQDKIVIDSLKRATERTKSMRYTQQTMKESSLIDQYDESTAQLIDNVQGFAGSVKELEKHQIAVQLMEEIPQLYQKIYLNRVHYDFHIEDYNRIVKEAKPMLEKYDSKFEKLEIKPKFQLSTN